MILNPAWREELSLAAVLAFGGLLCGIWAGFIVFAIAVVCAIYLGWHLFQLLRLNVWLENPKSYSRPLAFGVWRLIILRIEELRDRGRKRKRKLSRMLSGFQESTSALPDATVVLDDKGRVEWWNGVATRMLGLSRKHDKGERIDELIRDPVFRSYLADDDFIRPLQMPGPVDEGVILEVRIVPYGRGKHLLQARDITRLQQLETVRRDFVANVSHEIRTPLTVVHGYLETMSDSEDESLTAWQRIINQMQQQTIRMQRIVEDLLLLSRLESHQNTQGQDEINVPELLQSLLQEGRNLSAELNHDFRVEVDEGLWLIGEPAEIYSAFSNLLFNAIRYTPADGEITLSWYLDEECPCFSVTDTGIGIEPEHIPRLTERFYRVDVGRSRQSGGTGLGLAIVKHVLTRHGGQLRVKSEPGKGSCFTCEFPPHRVLEPAEAVSGKSASNG
jgi:two-component system phosphate regulon sensor histidine kinase PhoR